MRRASLLLVSLPRVASLLATPVVRRSCSYELVPIGGASSEAPQTGAAASEALRTGEAVILAPVASECECDELVRAVEDAAEAQRTSHRAAGLPVTGLTRVQYPALGSIRSRLREALRLVSDEFTCRASASAEALSGPTPMRLMLSVVSVHAGDLSADDSASQSFASISLPSRSRLVRAYLPLRSMISVR